MRRKYRSQAGIVYDILRILAGGPVNPTRLAQLANLPYDRLRDILERLVEKGYVTVEEEDGRRLYRITPAGLEALERLRQAKEILERLGYRF